MIFEDEDDSSRPKIRYYKSGRVLGKLYRNINEAPLLKELHNASGNTSSHTTDVLESLWRYVEQQTQGFEYVHLIDEAWDIKGMYGSSLSFLLAVSNRLIANIWGYMLIINL